MPNIISPLELHIEVLQGLQKVDGFNQDMFLQEEIDLQLNKQQGRFIEKLTNKEFQDRQVFLDYVKNIIVKNHSLDTFTIPTTSVDIDLEPRYEQQAVYGVLPTDYLHLISDRSTVYRRLDCADIEDSSIPTSTYSERVADLSIIDILETEYFKALAVTNQTDSTDIISTNNYYLRGQLIQDILKSGDPISSSIRFYWESYRNIRVPNTLLVVIPGTDPVKNYQIQYTKANLDESGTPPVVTANSSENTSSPLTFNQVDLTSIQAASTTYEYLDVVENKLAEADDLYDLRKNKFYKPDVKEPHSTLVNNFLIAYRDKSSIITNLTIDYVRKPQTISLSLNQGCELAGEAPRLIIDKTIEYFKLVIENPAYRGIVQDNETRNQT